MPQVNKKRLAIFHLSPKEQQILTIAVSAVVGVVLLAGLIVARPRLWRFVYGEAVVVDLRDFLDEWKANPVKTQAKYQKTGIIFTGKVRSVRGESGDTVTLGIDSKRSRSLFSSDVQITFRGSLISQLKDYPSGSRITVEVAIDDNLNYFEGAARRIIPTSPE